MDLLATPVAVGGLTLKNPIVFAPTSLGMPPKQALAKLTRIAQGGAGLIILVIPSAANQIWTFSIGC